MEFYDFPFSWECHNPNCYSLHHFSEGLVNHQADTYTRSQEPPPMATASSQRSLSSCIFQSSLCPAYSVPRTCFTTNCVIYVYNKYIYIYTSLINITYLLVVYLASSLPIYSLHPTYIYIYTIYTCFFHRVPQKYQSWHSMPMYY